MTPERWQQAQDLFHQALDLDPEERAAFLQKVCPDASLRAEVQALLDADAAPPSIFDTAQERTQTLPTDVQALSAGSDRAAGVSPIGRHIGPYRLVREIGRGGMGTVYLARRTDIDNDVALKLVRGSLAAPETVERFLRERRVLARLKHPNIGRLLDAGMTEEQTPYFVMEYVEGVPITKYCDERRLTISKRLALFQHVCQAVHYAHQNLIIHRDLKPPNIFVTDDGQVKLLDFGIAKLVEEDDEAGLTRTGMRLMTPEYAAPEQVRGQAATTATDVYALGVLLYELMTGHRPYALRGRSLGEIERIICEEEPVRPSVAARRYADYMAGGSSGEVPSSEAVRVLRTRHSDRLHRRIEGDLDVICLKALSKEPSHRYASAEALWEDIARHQSGLPVVARASTVRYRARKFVQRHRVGVSVTAVLVVVVAVLVAVFTLQLAEERDVAQTEAEKAEQVSSFLMGLFEASDPSEALGDTLTAFELLERGVARAEGLAEEPLVQAQMLSVVGQVYVRLGDYEAAGPLLERALALRRDAVGEEHMDVAASLNNLAALLRQKGDYAAAEPLFREALAMRRKLLGEEHVDVATSLNNLALLLHQKGDYAAAEPLYREALAMYRELLAEEHPSVATSLNNLALLLHQKGDYAAAEPLIREGLAMKRKLLGEEHPDLAISLSSLALLLLQRGDYAGAEPLYREALAMRRKLLGEEHPNVAISLNNLAALLRRKGDYAGAEPLYREALVMRRKLLGEEHPSVAASLNNLAALLRRKGDFAAAEPLFREALVMRRKLLGEEHVDVATSLNNLALLLHQKGDYAAAEPLFREALAMYRKLLGEKHPSVATCLRNLAALLRRKGDFAAAEPLFLEALTIFQNRLGEAHTRTREAYEGLAELYTAWGKPDQAAQWREQQRETEE